MLDFRKISIADRTIEVGDDIVELSNRELSLCAVAYKWRPSPGAEQETRYATPNEVLNLLGDGDRFQATPEEFEVMKLKAQRLKEIREEWFSEIN